jgi:hypothetical protein
MMNQELSQNQDAEMAEKCRKALEKSYGIDIPMPKCVVKKVNMQKNSNYSEAKKCSKIDYLKRSSVLKMGRHLMMKPFERWLKFKVTRDSPAKNS